jgi:uncharacterized protein YdaU (DUF1376 family)
LNTAPWFKTHAAEALGSRDLRFLTAEQIGYLFRLWCEAWSSDVRATIPADQDLLWRLAGAESRERFEANSKPVLAMFNDAGDGSLYSPMLMEQGQDLVKLSATRREAGKRGLKTRWNKNDSQQIDSNSMANATNLQGRTDLEVEQPKRTKTQKNFRPLRASKQDSLLSQVTSPDDWEQKRQAEKQKAKIASAMWEPKPTAEPQAKGPIQQ